MRVASINGKRYVLVIVDDYSRYTWTHFLRSKDDTPEVLIDFLRLVQRGLQAQVGVVRTDKGTDGENLDKMNEKGDECIFVGSDPAPECQTMASDQNSSDPAPECQTMALNHDSLKTHAENDQVTDDEFINIFSTLLQDPGETSSRHVDSSNTHTFYQ
nr:integrase, catalytic region, zinc finger, CCHC-type, peptidase aspartic, catalytic [Tanacetum cinerariifolium]